jgi:hypothetical protein
MMGPGAAAAVTDVTLALGWAGIIPRVGTIVSFPGTVVAS